MGGRGSLGRQTVFHQPDVHHAHMRRLAFFLIGRHRLGVAQRYGVQTVDGNLVFCHEVALDRFSQTLGTLNAGAARCGTS